MNKECKKCYKKFDKVYFYKRNASKDGLDLYCIECRKLMQKEWIKNNPEKLKAKRNRYYLKNKDFLYKKKKERDRKNPIKTRVQVRKYNRRYHLKKFYGVTEKIFDEMFLGQQGKCAICGLDDKKTLCVDHNHKNGKVRGLLCNKCNIKLGYYEEGKNFHNEATEYLKKYEALT